MDSFEVPAGAPQVDRRQFLAGLGRVTVAGVAGRGALLGAATAGTWAASAGTALADEGHGGAHKHSPEVLQQWFDTLYSGLMDEGTTPPPAARIYALAAIAGYEAVVAGSPGRRSLAGQLNGLTPPPSKTNGSIDWPTAASSAVGAVMSQVLSNAKAPFVAAINAQRAAHVDARRSAGVSAKQVDRSVAYGDAIGRHIAAWCATDGADGTFRPYTPPTGDASYWRSTPPNFGTAIDPYWGAEVRMMAMSHPDAAPPPPLPAPFSTSPDSSFWREAQAVINAVASGTDEDRAIALFWRDNPLTSGLPSGHWMRLVSQTAGEQGYALDRTAEALAMAGIALADAFTACWRGKYQVQLLRPISYIHSYMLPPPNKADGTPDYNHPSAWKSPVNTPQFPEYTSGHSVASQAVADVLTAVMGTFPFTDRTSQLRNPHIPPRSFSSFQHAAQEAAGSRLKGGIHYPMGIEMGMQQGRGVASDILARVSTRRPANV